jgi:type I restriction enzyme S subunit
VLFGKIRPYFHKVVMAPMHGVCSTDAIVIRSEDPKLTGLVLAVASSDEFVAHAVQTSNGTKMPRANWSVLADFPVAVPDDALARQFSDSVASTAWSASALAIQNRNLADARDLLLPKLVTGAIDVESLGVDDVFGWAELAGESALIAAE